MEICLINSMYTDLKDMAFKAPSKAWQGNNYPPPPKMNKLLEIKTILMTLGRPIGILPYVLCRYSSIL